jgi:hypothetical protein
MKSHLLVLALCVLMSFMCILTACVPQSQQQKPQFTTEELLQIEEHQFSKLCFEMRTKVAELGILSSEIANNNWSVVSGIKIYGSSNTLVPTLLPTKNDAAPLVNQFEICLDYASKIVNNSPYERSYSTAGIIERMTLPQWIELCKTFKNGINKVVNVTDSVKSRAINKFSIVELGFKNTNQSIQNQYVDKFQEEKGKYLKSLEYIKLELGRTQEILTKLIEWKFTLPDTSSSLQDEFNKRFPREKKLALMPFGEVQFEQEQNQGFLQDLVKMGFEQHRSINSN